MASNIGQKLTLVATAVVVAGILYGAFVWEKHIQEQKEKDLAAAEKLYKKEAAERKKAEVDSMGAEIEESRKRHEAQRAEKRQLREAEIAAQRDPNVRARFNFAELLREVYKREGRLISVTVEGSPEYRTLRLVSGLISEDTHTLRAAERETVGCDECMDLIRRLGFSRIEIVGPAAGYDITYDLK